VTAQRLRAEATTNAGRTFLDALRAMDAIDPTLPPVDWEHGIVAIEAEAREPLARALAESEERVRVLEAALGDWDAKAKAETDTSLHRMGHRDDPMAQQADNFAAEALYAAEDRLHSLVDPEWAALSEPETPR